MTHKGNWPFVITWGLEGDATDEKSINVTLNKKDRKADESACLTFK